MSSDSQMFHFVSIWCSVFWYALTLFCDMIAGSWLGEDAGVWGDVLGVGQGKPIIGLPGLGGLPGLPGLPGEWPGLLTGLLGVNPDLMLMLMDALLRSLGGDSLDIDWSLAASRKAMLALCDVTTTATLKEIYLENNLNLQNKKTHNYLYSFNIMICANVTKQPFSFKT